jgi:hypothetical protein
MAIRRLATSSLTTGGKSSKVWDQTTVQNDFFSIATAVVDSGNASSITFSSIPQNFTHLQLRVFGADDDVTSSYGNMQFNGDTTAAYSSHQLFGDGSSAQANNFPSNNQIYIHRISGNVTSTFGAVIVDILDYTSNKYKTIKSVGGFDSNGGGRVSVASGSWRSTSAITSINLTTGGTVWLQNTHIALYGIKGA